MPLKNKINYHQDWLFWGLNYLEIADLGCKEIINYNSNDKIKILYIPIIFNIKHGFEILIKTLIFVSEKRCFNKTDKTHDQYELLKKIIEKINSIKLSSINKTIKKIVDNNEAGYSKEYLEGIEPYKDIMTLKKDMEMLFNTVRSYYSLSFIKSKIEREDLIFSDKKNTLFKYPSFEVNDEDQPLVSIKLDSIVKKIELSDIVEMQIQINKTITLFIRVFQILLEQQK